MAADPVSQTCLYHLSPLLFSLSFFSTSTLIILRVLYKGESAKNMCIYYMAHLKAS